MTAIARTTIGFAIAFTAATMTFAQATGFKRTEVQRGDLSAPGREAVQAIAEIQPGASSTKHTHPGEEIAYVLEGTVRLEIDGMPMKNLKAGEGTIIPAGKAHKASNAGSGVTKVLATYVIEKGKPIATDVP
jgi:quercetin dioxygenase-like cupin family protein